MNEFILLFRRPAADHNTASPSEMEALTQKWYEWLGDIKAKDILVSGPTRLNPTGKVLKPGGVVTDGPFVEIKELLGGFIIIKAADMEEAITLSHGCPALTVGGSVEIRTTMA